MESDLHRRFASAKLVPNVCTIIGIINRQREVSTYFENVIERCRPMDRYRCSLEYMIFVLLRDVMSEHLYQKDVDKEEKFD